MSSSETDLDRMGKGKDPQIPRGAGVVHYQEIADESLAALDEFRLGFGTAVVDFLEVLGSTEEADIHLKDLTRLEGTILLWQASRSAVKLGNIASAASDNTGIRALKDGMPSTCC